MLTRGVRLEKMCNGSRVWVRQQWWVDLSKHIDLSRLQPNQRHIYETETSIRQVWFNKGPFDITLPACVSDQSAMFRLKHKRHHYTAEQAHYCWYQVGWLGHVDVLRVSSFKQCVGFGARPQHRLLFEKSIGAKQFISVKRIESAAKGRTRKQEHKYVTSPCILRGN